MFEISKEFHFSASHQLKGLHRHHPCARLHGHNYVIEVTLKSAKLNKVGFVRDYGELRDIKDFIDETLDHRHLNDVIKGINPTAENIAKVLYDKFKPWYPELTKVTVRETPKTKASYEQVESE